MWNWLGAAPAPVVTVPAEGDQEAKPESENTDGSTNVEADPSGTHDTAKNSGIIPIPTENVKQAAAQFGNYLFSFANVATNTASKLKDSATVHLDKTILGDFNRENEKFRQENEARRIVDGVPPWVGYHEETSMKRQILALSLDERNFLRSPPTGVDFVFNFDHKMPIAMATLKEDENLEKMRFQLVPKKITEEIFWRNYFYRVSLVKQSTQLSSMADQDMKSSHSSSTESLNKSIDKIELDVSQEEPSDDLVDLPTPESPITNEFVSDSFQADGGLSEEERNQMLGTTDDSSVLLSKEDGEENKDEWEFDKELQDEIESFELVNENTGDDDGNWEKEIEDLIELES